MLRRLYGLVCLPNEAMQTYTVAVYYVNAHHLSLHVYHQQTPAGVEWSNTLMLHISLLLHASCIHADSRHMSRTAYHACRLCD